MDDITQKYESKIQDLQKKLKKKEKKKIYQAKTFVEVIDKSNKNFYPCIVHDDHRVTWKQGKTEKSAEIKYTPHIMEIENRLIPNRLGRLFAPKRMRYIVYCVGAQDEFTHDPSITEFTEEQKIRVEQIIKLTAAASKANLQAKMMEGLKDKPTMLEYIPWLVMLATIGFFLFAFQVAPNM